MSAAANKSEKKRVYLEALIDEREEHAADQLVLPNDNERRPSNVMTNGYDNYYAIITNVIIIARPANDKKGDINNHPTTVTLLDNSHCWRNNQSSSRDISFFLWPIAERLGYFSATSVNVRFGTALAAAMVRMSVSTSADGSAVRPST